MASNSLYPGFVYLFYETGGTPHKMTIPISNPVEVGGVWYVDNAGGTSVLLSTTLVTLVNILRGFYPASATFLYYELWTMASPTADPIFRETDRIDIVGTSGSAPQAYGQCVFTFRTKLGGILKVYLMESVKAVNAIIQPPFTGNDLTFVTHMIGTSCIWFGRDGSDAIVCIRAVTKTSDALRKKYLLDV